MDCEEQHSMDEDLIAGLKCRVCKSNVCKGEAYMINYDKHTCVCINCELESIKNIDQELTEGEQ